MKTIRGLGLVALSAMALIAFPAAASASGGIVADAYPATVEGDGGNFVWSNNWGHLEECIGNSFETSLTEPSDEFSSTTLQKGNVEQDICFEPNGCKFEFNPGSGTVDIGPAGCGPMVMQTFFCQISVGAQTGLAATYQGDEVKLNTNNLQYTPMQHTVGCGTMTPRTANFSGTWKLSATDSENQPIGVDLLTSGDLLVGLFMSGDPEGAGEEGARFDAQIFPVQVAGAQDPSDQLRLLTDTGAEVKCTTAALDGGEMTTAAKQLPLNGSFSGCTFAGNSATIVMNSCRFTLTNEEGWTAPEYGGLGRIACTVPGDKIEVKSSPCSLRISEQWLLGGINEYTNVGSGSSATIEVDLKSSGLKFEKVGSLLACAFAGKEASVLGELSLSGTY